MARQQDVLQISVAAVECDVPHVPHHDVLHTNVVLPEKRKRENDAVFHYFLLGGACFLGRTLLSQSWGGGGGHKPWAAAAREWPLYMGHTLYQLSAGLRIHQVLTEIRNRDKLRKKL